MFTDHLDRNSVILCDAGSKKSEVLDSLSERVFATGKVNSLERLKEKILYRESLMSTGIGLGIAIPHVRYDGVAEIVLAAALCKSGIEGYDSIDGLPVRIVIMIAAPAKSHRDHIQMLAEIVAALKTEQARNALLEAGTPEKVRQLLQELASGRSALSQS